MKTCSQCGDVVQYCKCMLSDDTLSEIYTNSGSFSIFRGEEVAEWDREGRNLFEGDPGLINDIAEHLTGERRLIFHPGFELLMSVHDPYAVHYVASKILHGCTFSSDAPDWSRYSEPGTIY